MTVQLPTYVKEKVNTAILPVEYTAAVNAIQKCMTIDESKYWSDKADALAAWAKIYKNDRASVEAKRLKLHAYRRMNDIAEALQPTNQNRRRGIKGQVSVRGAGPGARNLLMKCGLSHGDAGKVRRIGAIPQKEFDDLINSPRPPGILKASGIGMGRLTHGAKQMSSSAWRLIASTDIANGGGQNLGRARTFCRNNSAKELGRGILPGEVKAAKALVRELTDWLDEFEQYLPKEK